MTRRAGDDPTRGFFQAAWLVIAQGGWWRAREVVQLLPLEVGTSDAHTLLWAMARRHGMLITRGDRRRREYAVGPDCSVPKGIPVAQVVQAVSGRTLAAPERAAR